jgi:hypothetical protein
MALFAAISLSCDGLPPGMRFAHAEGRVRQTTHDFCHVFSGWKKDGSRQAAKSAKRVSFFFGAQRQSHA